MGLGARETILIVSRRGPGNRERALLIHETQAGPHNKGGVAGAFAEGGHDRGRSAGLTPKKGRRLGTRPGTMGGPAAIGGRRAGGGGAAPGQPAAYRRREIGRKDLAYCVKLWKPDRTQGQTAGWPRCNGKSRPSGGRRSIALDVETFSMGKTPRIRIQGGVVRPE